MIEKPNVPEVESKGRPDEIVAQESWDNHLKRNDSIIVDLFHGQFKSKIICPSQSCGKVSITFDPFQMVSVPIPVKEVSKAPIYYISTKEYGKSPEKMTLVMNGASSVAEVKRVVAKFKGTIEGNLEIYSIQSFVIKEKIGDEKDFKYLIDCPGFPFIYDMSLPSKDNKECGIDASQHCLLMITINQESSWFYDNNKDISYPRLKYLPFSTNLNDLHLHVYDIIKPYLSKMWGETKNETKLNKFQEYETKVLKENVYKLSYTGGNIGKKKK